MHSFYLCIAAINSVWSEFVFAVTDMQMQMDTSFATTSRQIGAFLTEAAVSSGCCSVILESLYEGAKRSSRRENMDFFHAYEAVIVEWEGGAPSRLRRGQNKLTTNPADERSFTVDQNWPMYVHSALAVFFSCFTLSIRDFLNLYFYTLDV